jgi:hypothetical protein
MVDPLEDGLICQSCGTPIDADYIVHDGVRHISCSVVEALKRCQFVLSQLTEPNMKIGASVIYFQAASAERMARAALRAALPGERTDKP